MILSMDGLGVGERGGIRERNQMLIILLCNTLLCS